MNKKTKYILIGIGITILIIFIAPFFIPVAGKIVEDRPVLTFTCHIQPFVYVGGCGSFDCADEQDYTFKKLKEWTDYSGCNESTKGYDGHGRIKAGSLKCCKVVVLT